MAISIILAEQNILRAILNNPDLLYRTNPDYFVSPIARNIFNAIRLLYQNKMRITPRSIYSEISKSDSTIDEAKISHLFQLEVVEGESAFEFLYDSLRKECARNNLQGKAQETLVETTRKGELNVDALVNLRNDIDKQLDIIKGKESIVLTGVQVINSYEEEIKKREGHYYSTGDKYLDSHITMGEWPGTQTALYASTGMGKTDFALMLFKKQINKKIPCIYVSLEMPKSMLMDRIIASTYRIPINNLYPKSYDEEGMPDYVYDVIKKEKAAMEKATYFRLVDTPSLSLEELEDIIKNVKQEMNVNYLNVFVDLMSMVDEFSKSTEGMNRADSIEVGMNRTNAIAKRHDVHLFNIFQANRATDNLRLTDVEEVDRLRPTLNSLKSSGAIAERSRLALSAFRARYYVERYLPDAPELTIMEDILEIDVLKQSQGGPSRLRYLFDGPTARIVRFMEETGETNTVPVDTTPDPTPDNPEVMIK